MLSNASLKDGLTGLWRFDNQEPSNLITGERSVVQVAANCRPVGSRNGAVGLQANDGGSLMLRLAAASLSLLNPARDRVTVAIWTKLEGGSERASAFDSTYGGNHEDGFAWDPNAVGVVRRFIFGTTGYSIDLRNNDTRPILRVFSVGPASVTDLNFWWSEDGNVISTSTTDPNTISATGSPLYLGGSGGDAFKSWPQHALGMAVWKEYKPPGFAAELGRDLEKLYPKRRSLFSLGSAGPAPRAAAAALLEASDRLAAGASNALTTNAALFEVPDSFSAAVAVLAGITASLFEAPDVVTGDAAAALVISAALQEEADLAAATGTLSLQAEALLQEAQDLLASFVGADRVAQAALQELDDRITAVSTTGGGDGGGGGDCPTVASIWNTKIEGDLSAANLLSLMAAVLAGKTTIAGAHAEFMAVDGTDVRVAADMVGSERVAVVVTPSISIEGDGSTVDGGDASSSYPDEPAP